MTPAVIYARYSSHNQNETTIEVQLKICNDYARKNGYIVIDEYIDKAMTGTNDRRVQFQKMLRDSKKRKFEKVIIYKTDRFARNKEESTFNKHHLKQNGVRVESATENITDTKEGKLLETFYEGMAEFYSNNLSENVKDALALSIANCKFIGSFVPLGYKIDENKHYQLDEKDTIVIKKIFELYATGYTLKSINETIIKEFGKPYFKNAYNSINRILENKNYIGVYTRGGSDIKDGMPRIVSDELFERVQLMRNKKKKTPASARAYEEYLLTTKLFCGYDKQMMVGTGGTSKTGKVYHYYSCKNVLNKKGCKKNKVKKDYIENFILSKAREQLTDENISIIAKTVSEISKRENETHIISDLKKQLKENETAIDNLLYAIEKGEHIDLLSERITKKKEEKKTLETALQREQLYKTEIDETEIKFFLTELKNGNVDDINYKRAIISIFVNSIYLYDDKVTILFNASDRPVEVDFSLIDDVENSENDANMGGNESSYMINTAPPMQHD